MTFTNPFTASDDDWWVDDRPGWRRTIVGAYDRLAASLGAADPGVAIRRCGELGRYAHGARLMGPTVDELARLFVTWPRARLVPIARELAVRRFRNRAAIALADRFGRERLTSLLDPDTAGAIERLMAARHPQVFITWHVGAIFGVGAALRAVHADALMLRNLPLQTIEARASALKHAIDQVRGGGMVLTVPDGPGGSHTDGIACLGRQILLRRGPFMLARVTGIPLTPIVARWTPDGRFAVRIDPPLDMPSAVRGAARFEDELAASAARWLERYLAHEPQELWLHTLRKLLEAPLTPGGAALRR